MNVIIFLLLSFLTCSCGSKGVNQSYEEERLKENMNYASMLFQEQAPEALPLAIDSCSDTRNSLAALDALFIQQAKSGKTAPEKVLHTILSNQLDSKAFDETRLREDMDKQIDQLTIYAATPKKSFRLTLLSPICGQGCLQAFVHKKIDEIKLPHLSFPLLVGIEIEKKPLPYLILVEQYEEGIPYSQLIKKESAIRLLGQALGEFHKSTSGKPKELSDSWKEAIRLLSEKALCQYQDSKKQLYDSVHTITNAVNNLLMRFQEQHKKFDISYTLSLDDMGNFLLKKDGRILCQDPSKIANSIQITNEGTPCGLSGYDFASLTHHLTYLASRALPNNEVKKIRQAFKEGYEEGLGSSPQKDEMLLFLLIDLLDRIDKEWKMVDSPKKAHTIPLSRLEQEVLEWAKSLKEAHAA